MMIVSYNIIYNYYVANGREYTVSYQSIATGLHFILVRVGNYTVLLHGSPVPIASYCFSIHVALLLRWVKLFHNWAEGISPIIIIIQIATGYC